MLWKWTPALLTLASLLGAYQWAANQPIPLDLVQFLALQGAALVILALRPAAPHDHPDLSDGLGFAGAELLRLEAHTDRLDRATRRLRRRVEQLRACRSSTW
jgi:hypothetical protein